MQESESVTGKITKVYQQRTSYNDLLVFDGISSTIRSSLHVDLINENGEKISDNNFATGLNGEWKKMNATGHLHKIPHQNLTLLLKTRDQTQTLDTVNFSWRGFPEDKSDSIPEPISESRITRINITPKQGYAGEDIVLEAWVSDPDTAVHLDIIDKKGKRRINTGQVVFDKPFKHVLTLSKHGFEPGTYHAVFYTTNFVENKIDTFEFLGSSPTQKTKPPQVDKPGIISDHKQWDVFILHASEDKESVAKPFAEKLRKLNLDVWYDEFSLKWGKSLRKSIDEGLSNSLFGIVVLSKIFFQKTWTQIELDGLTTIMTTTGKDIILPLRYEISHDEVAKVSPTLAGIFSRSWDEGIDNLANEVKELVEGQKLVKSKQKTPSEPSYATTSVSKSKFTGLFDPKYVGRACGRCGRRVKEEHYITDGKCSFCGYDLDGDRLTFGM